jgi:hypothetical protein
VRDVGQHGQPLLATQQRHHSRDQFAGAERFGQVVVGTAFQAEHLVGFGVFRGQHQDGRQGVGAVQPGCAA